MQFSYGWPENETNPAFKNRSLCLDSKKPCLLVGRNGTGKTLASKLLMQARNMLFGKLDEYKIGLDFMKKSAWNGSK